jgi:hypothetical protein
MQEYQDGVHRSCWPIAGQSEVAASWINAWKVGRPSEKRLMVRG